MVNDFICHAIAINNFFQFLGDRDCIPNQTIFVKDKYVGANSGCPKSRKEKKSKVIKLQTLDFRLQTYL
jgi:hypothetical protein